MCESLRAQLRGLVVGRVCILGVGNRDRHDDGVGPRILDALRGRTAAVLVDAGTAPENHLERVVCAKPDTVLIVDAMDLGAAAGTVRLLPPGAIRGTAVSTHASSLALCARYIGVRTGAVVALIGIQPARLGAGAGLSAEVAAALDEVCEALPRAGASVFG